MWGLWSQIEGAIACGGIRRFGLSILLVFHHSLFAAPAEIPCPDRLEAALIECRAPSQHPLCDISLEGPWNQAAYEELRGIVTTSLQFPTSIREGDYLGYAIWGGPDTYYESETLLGAGAIRAKSDAMGNISNPQNVRTVNFNFPVWEVGTNEVNNVSLAILFRSQSGDRRFYLQQGCVIIPGTGVLTGNGLNWESRPGSVQSAPITEGSTSASPAPSTNNKLMASCSLQPDSELNLKNWLWLSLTFYLVLFLVRRYRFYK